MAVRGQQLARDLTDEDLDPAFLAWSMHARMNTEALPPGRLVLEFAFEGVPESLSRFWLVSEERVVDLCIRPPGLDTDLLVLADLRRFVGTWRGFRDLRAELKAGTIRLSGPVELQRQFPAWLLRSGLAPYERRRDGRERRLFEASRRDDRSAATPPTV
ncbi:hypothetical protein [Engelhardtia mirabilis]